MDCRVCPASLQFLNVWFTSECPSDRWLLMSKGQHFQWDCTSCTRRRVALFSLDLHIADSFAGRVLISEEQLWGASLFSLHPMLLLPEFPGGRNSLLSHSATLHPITVSVSSQSMGFLTHSTKAPPRLEGGLSFYLLFHNWHFSPGLPIFPTKNQSLWISGKCFSSCVCPVFIWRIFEPFKLNSF